MFISNAIAQTADTATAVASTGSPSFLMSVAPLILVFFVFYVLVIRPQNKKIVEHRKMINELKKGDKVVTGGGVLATVVKLQGDDEVVLEIANDTEVTVLRHTLMSLRKGK
jgi:preprotein translocase subunit YajC